MTSGHVFPQAIRCFSQSQGVWRFDVGPVDSQGCSRAVPEVSMFSSLPRTAGSPSRGLTTPMGLAHRFAYGTYPGRYAGYYGTSSEGTRWILFGR